MKNSPCRSLATRVSWVLSILCAAAICAFASNAAQAQGSAQDEVKPGPTAADHAAAAEASVVYRHARPAITPAGAAMKHEDVTARIASAATPAGAEAVEDNDQIRFPADLTFNGGAVVTAAESHAIYLLPHGKCLPIATCWGNPEGFLRDVEISEFAHITDQYVHTGANNRYTVGKHTMITYTPTPNTAPLTDLDMQAVVHAVASLSGQTGYGHIYHVFLPPGQDECFTGTHICYSPDVLATFIFCAYHSSVDFKDIGHVLYSVEPFQNVFGCNVRPGTPNGPLVDATNNVLSHELIETITDPDGTAWFNILDNGLFGQEIGDECSFLAVVSITPLKIVGFDPTVFTIGNHRYAIQPEYSNDAHACATSF